MVAGCKKCGKIAQTTSPSRFQLDFVAIPLGISLISCCYTQPPRRLLHVTFTHSHLLLYAELWQRSLYAATETKRCYKD